MQSADYLTYYATQFQTVEVDSTFGECQRSLNSSFQVVIEKERS